MKLEKIVSDRYFVKDYCNHIIYEWEDIISQKLGMAITPHFLHMKSLIALWCYIFRLPRNRIPITKSLALAFVLRPEPCYDMLIAGKNNILPVIIDFWLSSDEEFALFEQRYSNNPAVLMTSREAYFKVCERCPKIRAIHWGLSIPDFRINLGEKLKRWDCVLVGRPNRLLYEWVRRYADTHRDFTYVFNARTVKCPCNYVSSKGEALGDALATREKYFELLGKSRVGLYSTPSIDGSRKEFKGMDSFGYDQVTPRFLEYLASGCHVIARYPKNPDTDYYEMNRIAPHVDCYSDFESRMDAARSTDVDYASYIQYLAKHSTSTRAFELTRILEQI